MRWSKTLARSWSTTSNRQRLETRTWIFLLLGGPSLTIPAARSQWRPLKASYGIFWLPKVRTAINNEWMSEEPQPAVKLFETWSSYLPAFICDNLLDQNILPKVLNSPCSYRPLSHPVVMLVDYPVYFVKEMNLMRTMSLPGRRWTHPSF